MTMKKTIYGYARVSSAQQDLSIQLQQLKSFKCNKIYEEKVSGKNTDNRKEFLKLIEITKPGDFIVVCKLDRFARSTTDALNTIDKLNKKNVGLIVLNMGSGTDTPLDTTSAMGKLLLIMLSAVAEFELSLSKERQAEGIFQAKQRNVYKGRPRRFGVHHKGLQHALKLFNERDVNKMTVSEIVEITKVGRSTLYNAIKATTASAKL